MTTVEKVGQQAALLSAVEIGLGSVLHSLHIPLSGHLLSLNQGYLLSRAVVQDRTSEARFFGARISSVAAVLKSLSPAGKKLTPMLAISAQGVLHSIGTAILGPNFLGVVIGSGLAAVWSFLQPVLLYYFFYGDTLFSVGTFFLEKLDRLFEIRAEQVLFVFGLLVSIKVLLATILAAFASFRSNRIEKFYERILKREVPRLKHVQGKTSSISLALNDLFQPLFLISLGLTVAFFVATGSGQSQVVWAVLRPIAIAFILFYLIRVIPFGRLANRTRGTRLSRFLKSVEIAVSHLRND